MYANFLIVHSNGQAARTHMQMAQRAHPSLLGLYNIFVAQQLAKQLKRGVVSQRCIVAVAPLREHCCTTAHSAHDVCLYVTHSKQLYGGLNKTGRLAVQLFSFSLCSARLLLVVCAMFVQTAKAWTCSATWSSSATTGQSGAAVAHGLAHWLTCLMICSELLSPLRVSCCAINASLFLIAALRQAPDQASDPHSVLLPALCCAAWGVAFLQCLRACP